MGLFSSDKTYSLEPMLTPEQKQAQQLLMQLANTGQIAGLTTGDQYTGAMGSYTPTGTEQLAGNRIYDLLNSGNPDALKTAESTFTGLANNKFNPDDPSSGYAAYQRQVARSTSDANDVLNREAAITGNRFGDRILNSKRDLAMQQSDLLSTKLADLYNSAQDRSLQGAQGLTNLANVSDTMQLNRIKTGMDVGNLQRLLDTAKAQDQYSEWQRARNERLGTSVNAANSVWNRNVPYGLQSLTTTQQTPWGMLLNAGLGAAGTALGGPLGGMISGGISNLFTTAGTQGGMFPTASEFAKYGGSAAGSTPKGYSGTIQRF